MVFLEFNQSKIENCIWKQPMQNEEK